MGLRTGPRTPTGKGAMAWFLDWYLGWEPRWSSDGQFRCKVLAVGLWHRHLLHGGGSGGSLTLRAPKGLAQVCVGRGSWGNVGVSFGFPKRAAEGGMLQL